MAIAVDDYSCRSRKLQVVLPQVSAFPASFDIEEGCGGSYAAGRGQGCPTTISYGSLPHTWSDSGTRSDTTSCGGLTPPPSVSWSVAWTASVSSVGDQGNGYWRYQVHIGGTPTGCTVGNFSLKFNSVGSTYVDGDYIDVAYLQTVDIDAGSGTISFDVTLSCSAPLVHPDGDTLTGTFTAYGFYSWTAPYDIATMALGGNDRFELGEDCTLSTYCSPPTASTGVVPCRRAEYKAFITGATPFTFASVYFHIESRTIGSGSWTETTQISSGWVADADGNFATPWVWVNLGDTTYEYRLKSIDFTDFFGGPPPGP